MTTLTETSREEPRSIGATLALAVAVVVHLVLVAYFVRRAGVESGSPNVFAGFGIEAYRLARARLSTELASVPWTYDPMTLAGQRAGLVEPLGSRLFLGAATAWPAYEGGPVRLMTAVVLGLSALFPFLGYASAALLRLPARARTLTFAAFSTLWFFDSFVHGAWAAGRVAWAFSSALIVLSLSSSGRTAEDDGVIAPVVGALSGLAAAAVHPVAGIVVAAFSLLRALSLANAPLKRRAGVLVTALLPVAWLVGTRVTVPGALSSEPLATAWSATPIDVVWDLLEIPSGHVHGPGATRTLFRSLVIVAGLVGLTRWHRERDPSRFALVPVALSGLVVGYAGSLWRRTWPLDPPLFLIPALLALAIPASQVMSEIPWRKLALERGSRGKMILAATLALGVPRLFRTVGTFIPELLPTPIVRAPGDGSKSALVGLFEPMPDALPYAPAPKAMSELASFLTAKVEEGRVLALETSVAALLTLRTPLDVLGPLAERGARSRDADSGRLLEPGATWERARAYLEDYAVSWVVLPLVPSVFDGEHDGLEPPILVFGYRVRKVRRPTALVLEGEVGSLERRLGRIRVEGARGERVTLRLHHDDRLACRPACRVVKREVDFDAAGFLSIPAPPPAFEIFFRP